MKTYLDCYPCFMSQALRAAKIATHNEKEVKRVLETVSMILSDMPLESTPPEIGRMIYHKIGEITGNSDPYKEIKKENTQKALGMYPFLKTHVENTSDRLLTAVRVAIAGNVIDFGARRDLNIEKEVADALDKDFSVCDDDAFRKTLERTRSILYLADNAGECVFDRILIETMDKPVIYVVRDTPIINDAVYEDAVQAGIEKVATIFSSGTDAPGTVLSTCSEAFHGLFANAEMIISKGQGNYEALSGGGKPVFFLLMAKCEVIARDVGANEGDIVLKSEKP